MDAHPRGTFGERIISPVTIWDRIVRWGLFCLALSAIVAVILSAFVYLVLPFRVIFAPVALALVVVYMLNPLVTRLERRGIKRGLGVAIVYVAFVALVSLAMSLIVPIIARQITGFIDNLPGYVEHATKNINEFAEKRGSDFRIDLTTEKVRDYVVHNRAAIIGVLGGVKSFAFGLIHILITLIIGIVLSVYILLDLPKIQATVRSLLPEGRREELTELAERVSSVLGSFFRGQLLVALFVGVASAVGLTLVKVPFAAVVGLIAGVFNLVPLIGPFIGAIPAVILGLLSGEPIRALWGALVLLTVQQIDNHIISPNVMGRTVKLHPITVMLALLFAGSLFGIFGMLLIIPTIAALKMVGQYLWEKRSVREAVAAAIPDTVQPAMVTDAVLVEEEITLEEETLVVAEPVVRKKSPGRPARATGGRRTTRGSPAAKKRRR
jgi:predicted PurR-regulated permease PerM